MVLHCLKFKVLSWNIVPFLLPLQSYIPSLPCCTLCSSNTDCSCFPVHAVLLEHVFVQDVLCNHQVSPRSPPQSHLFRDSVQMQFSTGRFLWIFRINHISFYSHYTVWIFSMKCVSKYSRIQHSVSFWGGGRRSHRIHYRHPVNYQTICK